MTKCGDKKKIYLIISWGAVFLWMALIFNLSAQVADNSNELSKGITQVIAEAIEKIAPEADFDLGRLNHLIRKNAHFFCYLTLGVLVMNALKGRVVVGRRAFWMALSICVLYAASDEVHQLFVPGRGGQLKDVLLDSAGAIVGIAIMRDGSKLFGK